MSTKKRQLNIARRAHRVRSRITGTAERPRLSVKRSAKHIYAQLIDDISGKTLAAATNKQIDASGKKPVEVAKMVGELLAKKAKDAKVESAVFDRGPYRYHGRIAALAEGAREGGLKF